MGEHAKINAAPFIEFLNNALPPLLSTTKDDISRTFANLEMVNKVKHFVGDEQDNSLFVSRVVVDKEKGDTSTEEDREYSIVVEPEVSFKGTNASTVAFIKANPATFRAAYEGNLSEKQEGGDTPIQASSTAVGNFVPHL